MTTDYASRQLNSGIEGGLGDAPQQDKNKDLIARLGQVTPVSGNDYSTLPTAAQMERAYIERVLGAVGYNKTRAAEVLDIDRRTLHRKLKAYQAL